MGDSKCAARAPPAPPARLRCAARAPALLRLSVYSVCAEVDLGCKNYWEAQKWREVGAGYMNCATFALAQNRRQTGAQYVIGEREAMTFFRAEGK